MENAFEKIRDRQNTTDSNIHDKIPNHSNLERERERESELSPRKLLKILKKCLLSESGQINYIIIVHRLYQISLIYYDL